MQQASGTRALGDAASRGPKVLFVDHAGALGGAELYLLDIARMLPLSKEVLLFEDGPFRLRLEEAGIPVFVDRAAEHVLAVSREAGLMRVLKALPHLAGLIIRTAHQARKADVLYANSQKALIVGALAGWLARRPVVWNLHDVLSTEHFSRLNIRAAVSVANLFVTHVIANSEASRIAWHAAGGRVPTTVVHNGINPDPFDAVTPTEIESLRRELGLNPDLPTVGVFSRIAHWKGQHVLLEALTQLPGVHALLVGGVLFREDEAYAEELHNYVRTHGLQDRVHFLGFRDDIPVLMKLVDVVAHTSTSPEPFGRVIVEGMMAGTPVVASRAGGALEIIEDGVSGLLVEPGDAAKLAEAISSIVAQRSTATDLIHGGQTRALRHFSLASIADRIRRIIDEAASIGETRILVQTLY